ncbi:hypothetical protein [Rickettsiella endosymbiont of Dermanyssus gallinae]|uniref:hypothetical protein n=1 Tax=Rickettsiella endosymbiont of Dermanyssus gallinae TaxID=2856608 RepID=UPI001C52B961|nr:hypothetical protein [Rickettsiella endosymbiont of Dermanyssus gallinae]
MTDVQPKPDLFQFGNNPVTPIDPAVAQKKAPNPLLKTVTKPAPLVPKSALDNLEDKQIAKWYEKRYQADPVSRLASAIEGAKESTTANIVDWLMSPNFESDDNFDSGEAVKASHQGGAIYNKEEAGYLLKSNSLEEYEYKQQKVLDHRESLEIMAANPWSAAAGAIGADLPLLVSQLSLAGYGLVGNTATASLDVLNLVAAAKNRIGGANVGDWVAAAIGTGAIAPYAYRTGVNALDIAKTKWANGEPVIPKGVFTNVNRGYTQTPPKAATQAKEEFSNNFRSNSDSMFTTAELASDTAPARLMPDPDIRPVRSTRIDKEADAIQNAQVRDTKLSRVYNPNLEKDIPYTEPTKIRSYVDNSKLSITDKQVAHQLLDHLLETNPHLKITANTKYKAPGSYTLRNKHIIIKAKDLNNMSKAEGSALMHELLHAGTVHQIADFRAGKLTGIAKTAAEDLFKMHKKLKALYWTDVKIKRFGEKTGTKYNNKLMEYALQSPEELVANLFTKGHQNNPLVKYLHNTPSLLGAKESTLRTLTRKLLQLLQVNTDTNTAYTDLINSLHDLLSAKRIPKDELATTAFFMPNLESDMMRESRKAVLSKADPDEVAADPSKYRADVIRHTFRKASKLNPDLDYYTRVAKYNQETTNLASSLFADAADMTGSMSATDYKRIIEGKLVNASMHFEEAISDVLNKHFGFGKIQQMFGRDKLIKKYKEINQAFTEYMHQAYDADIAGRVIPEVPNAAIADLVKAYKESRWAEIGYKEGRAAGFLNDVAPSEYYLPRRYSTDKISHLIQQGFSTANIKTLLRRSIKDLMPEVDASVLEEASQMWLDRLTKNGSGRIDNLTTFSGDNSKKIAGFIDAGFNADSVMKFISEAQEAKGLSSNLKNRTAFDTNKIHDIGEGKRLRLADLLDTDVTRLMQRYNAIQSGRYSLAHVGFKNLTHLRDEVNRIQHTAGVPTQWSQDMITGIDAILGYLPSDNNKLLQSVSSLGSLMALGGSGYYAAIDFGIAAFKYGYTKVFKAILQGGMWKDFTHLIENPQLREELSTILNAVPKDDVKWRLIHNYAMDNSDLNVSGTLYRMIRSSASGTHYLNGMKYVLNGQINLNSGLLYTYFNRIFKGVDVVGEKSHAEAMRILRDFGMTDELAARLKGGYSPEGLFEDSLQRELNGVGLRAMDYFVQKGRLGEAPYFAEFTPVMKQLMGWNKFALVAQNKLLRNESVKSGNLGISMMLLYQMPFSLMLTALKNKVSGAEDYKTTAGFISDAAMNTTMLGVMSSLPRLLTRPGEIGQIAPIGAAGSWIGNLITATLNPKDKDLTVEDYLKAAPLLRINPIVRAVGRALSDD